MYAMMQAFLLNKLEVAAVSVEWGTTCNGGSQGGSLIYKMIIELGLFFGFSGAMWFSQTFRF
jgi:hypothetical protein